MKCPLLLAGYWSSIPGLKTVATDCLKEECAWWHEENNVCAILTLGQGLPYLHKALLVMGYKIPDEEQFRK